MDRHVHGRSEETRSEADSRMNAETAIRQAQSTRAVELAHALDIALVEYNRRYGGVRFDVTEMRITTSGVEFTVAPAKPGT